MFIKKLMISWKDWVIREINFHRWLNLIVDETPLSDEKDTGNNVWKTTVLKLIDFCFWAKPNIIYTDDETKEEYSLVKEFLIDNEILITLILTEKLDDNNANYIKIERNFLKNKNSIVKVNSEKKSITKIFEATLLNLLFPNLIWSKPSLRQIISHNIRYRDYSINHTLKTLSPFTKLSEYEALYLYLFNCNFSEWWIRQELNDRIKQEITFKNRLEKENTRNKYETLLNLINKEIQELKSKKLKIKINPDFELDVSNFNSVKYRLSKLGSELTRLDIRKNIIHQSNE